MNFLVFDDSLRNFICEKISRLFVENIVCKFTKFNAYRKKEILDRLSNFYANVFQSCYTLCLRGGNHI